MKITTLPKTTPGKWSTGLIGGFILFFIVFLCLVASGQRGGETFLSNLTLAVPILLAAVTGIAAFFTGTFGVIFRREPSVLVFLAIIIGLFVLIFCLGEVLLPH